MEEKDLFAKQEKLIRILLLFFYFFVVNLYSQEYSYLSVGTRSTLSAFSDDGVGLGAGGHFRIPLSKKVNTEWFADFITINNRKVRSVYYHIGWSVMFYPINLNKLSFYVLAGHCFDYNYKKLILYPSVQKDRWGAAAQIGLGTQINIENNSNISITTQYMGHLTKKLEATENNIISLPGNFLEGHLLITISYNFNLFKLWKLKK